MARRCRDSVSYTHLDWQRGQSSAPQLPPITWGNKVLASLANMAVVKYQLRKLSQGDVYKRQALY